MNRFDFAMNIFLSVSFLTLIFLRGTQKGSQGEFSYANLIDRNDELVKSFEWPNRSGFLTVQNRIVCLST